MQSVDGWVAASTILTFLSTVAAATAVFAALKSLRYSRKTVEVGSAGLESAERTLALAEASRRDADAARIDAEKARQEAALDRAANERERYRQRLQVISDLVEQIYWAAEHESVGTQDRPSLPNMLQALLNRLNHEMVGIRDKLPRCAEVYLGLGAASLLGRASAARGEIELALSQLAGVDDW